MKAYLGLAALSALLLAAPADAAGTAPDQCAAMNYLLAQARSEFPELAKTKLNPARCTMAKQEFKCVWGFSSDRFVAATEQASRLAECTAAQPGAQPLEGKRGEVRVQLNPETSVSIRGPEANSGDWKLTLRIISTAEWN
jgi:hypothetical protein